MILTTEQKIAGYQYALSRLQTYEEGRTPGICPRLIRWMIENVAHPKSWTTADEVRTAFPEFYALDDGMRYSALPGFWWAPTDIEIRQKILIDIITLLQHEQSQIHTSAE
jgi:hypothetical protein